MNNIYTIEKLQDVTVLNLDINAVLVDDNEPLKKAFTLLLEEGNKKVVIDLSKTDYVSSLVIASFVFLLKKAQEAGGNLVFCSMNNKIKDVFMATNLDKIFDIAADRNEALTKFSGK